MERRSLLNRVQLLEKTVDQLRELPARLEGIEHRVAGCEGQILQLRSEMRAEFSNVRGEMRTEFAAVHADMQAASIAVREEMQAGFGKVTDDIKHGDEETRRFMRVLYEDLVARIATLGERPTQ